MQQVEPILWTTEGVVMLDQRRLPGEVVYHTYTDYRDVAGAIKDMVIRGAPAIGVAAAMGAALGARQSRAQAIFELRAEFSQICDVLAKTRPTAVDLFWALARMRRRFDAEVAKANVAAGSAAIYTATGAADKAASGALAQIREALVEEALALHRERREQDEAIGHFGAALMPQDGRVMTQCNAGALATGGIGTALGVIRVAVREGHKLEILVPETRPYLQGARLTAWELHQEGIPLKLITDNMVGHTLKTGKIGAIVVGADRIAANGDTANKIGTYPMAVLAREHDVPFYVAAPLSTLDLSIPNGDHIPIEQRPQEEVTHMRGVRISPDVAAENPAFDVTPAKFIAAIITERGVARAPFNETLAKLAQEPAG